MYVFLFLYILYMNNTNHPILSAYVDTKALHPADLLFWSVQREAAPDSKMGDEEIQRWNYDFIGKYVTI